MPQANTTHCTVRHVAGDGALQLDIVVTGPSSAAYRSAKRVDLKDIQNCCDNYWAFVNEEIEAGALMLDVQHRQAFLDELRTKGSVLKDLLFDHPTASRLWRLARASESLTIVNELPWIPWEALFHSTPDFRGFLSDCCVISRWQPNGLDESIDIDQKTIAFERERIVCIDSVVESTQTHSSGSISKSFEDEGEVVYVTSLKGDFHSQISNVKVIHWICEHAAQGLRLSEHVHYCIDDCLPYRFPRRAVLILTSCGTGSKLDFRSSMAGQIASSSGCTVIAPSSVIVASAGIEFARRINTTVKVAPSAHTVKDVWSDVRDQIASRKNGDQIGAEACFSLFYGIYGDATIAIKAQNGN